MPTTHSAIELCGDDELGYARDRTRFTPGAGLVLDESYRLAHLPLVAPGHPRVIRTREGATYRDGRHDRVYSLVLPVAAAALHRSPGYRELERELRRSPLAAKIAWEILDRRRDKLHATIVGSLATGEKPRLDARALRELSAIGPIHVELRGLFSGNVNVGRLYLRIYPERRDGANVFRLIQRLLGRRETDLYVVGVFNLVDDLDAGEAAALAALIERWWQRSLLRMEATSLWLLGAMDDLALDGAVEEIVPLVR